MNQDHPKSRPDPDAEPPHEDLARMHFWRIQSVRDILVIVLALTVVWLGYRMSAITVPLLVALGLAYLFEPVISVLQRKLKWQRTAAVSLILGLFMTGVILVAVPVGVVVVGQTASFVRNVVIVFTDDQGWGDLSCFGSTAIPTPHIDRLADEGMRFTDFYTSQPVCSAARA